MGTNNWEATDTDREIARTGIVIQAEAYGLDPFDPHWKGFIDNLVEVKATALAEARFKDKCIQDMTVVLAATNSKVEKVYSAGYNGICYVGTANYREREAAAKRHLSKTRYDDRYNGDIDD